MNVMEHAEDLINTFKKITNFPHAYKRPVVIIHATTHHMPIKSDPF
jgi:hypothetical protein